MYRADMALPWSNYLLGPKLKMAPGRAVPTLPTVCVYETSSEYTHKSKRVALAQVRAKTAPYLFW